MIVGCAEVDTLKQFTGVEAVLDIVGRGVGEASASFDYHGGIVVGKAPFLDIRRRLEVLDLSTEKADAQDAVYWPAIVVPRYIERPADLAGWRDEGIHTPAVRGPHLGMPIGKSDFDVADVAHGVPSLARNVDD